MTTRRKISAAAARKGKTAAAVTPAAPLSSAITSSAPATPAPKQSGKGKKQTITNAQDLALGSSGNSGTDGGGFNPVGNPAAGGNDQATSVNSGTAHGDETAAVSAAGTATTAAPAGSSAVIQEEGTTAGTT
ncbi:hypothetical protein CF319_g9590, partial [Tilletia indica]